MSQLPAESQPPSLTPGCPWNTLGKAYTSLFSSSTLCRERGGELRWQEPGSDRQGTRDTVRAGWAPGENAKLPGAQDRAGPHSDGQASTQLEQSGLPRPTGTREQSGSQATHGLLQTQGSDLVSRDSYSPHNNFPSEGGSRSPPAVRQGRREVKAHVLSQPTWASQRHAALGHSVGGGSRAQHQQCPCSLHSQWAPGPQQRCRPRGQGLCPHPYPAAASVPGTVLTQEWGWGTRSCPSLASAMTSGQGVPSDSPKSGQLIPQLHSPSQA